MSNDLYIPRSSINPPIRMPVIRTCRCNPAAFSPIGPELITNGTFDGQSSSGWTLQATWSVSVSDKLSGLTDFISTYYATHDTVQFVAGRLYKVQFDVDAIGGGGFNLQIGGSTVYSFASTGTHTQNIVPTVTGVLRFEKLSNRNITLDNISVRELF